MGKDYLLKTYFLVFIIFSNQYAQSDSLSLSKLTSLKGPFNYFLVDSTENIPPEQFVSHKYSAINLTGQFVFGTLFSSGFSILPLVATTAYEYGNHDGKSVFIETILTTTLLSSFIIGSALGVHIIAKRENPKMSFWETVGYSAIGAGIGALLITILSTQYETIPGGGSVALFCPTLGSMFYASFISKGESNVLKNSATQNNSLKDIFEMSKQVNIELFQINF